MNRLQVLNKSTGEVIQTLSVTNPKSLCVDANDNLWMVTGTNTVSKYTVNANGTLSGATVTLGWFGRAIGLAGKYRWKLN
jgi:sugar lactone lactonase YvrE